MTNTDLIIIGSGPGGYELAANAAKAGLSVVLCEKDQLGGTCLNRGCIPTKALCRNAEILSHVKEAQTYGVEIPSFAADFSKAMERKNQVVAQLQEGIKMLLSNPNITIAQGVASMKDANTVVVNEVEYSAKNIVIATGSAPAMLPIPGVDLPGVITSDEMLSIESLPKRLCIVGGGVIGMEFAGIFSTYGVEVTVVEYCKEILPNFDKDVAKRLKSSISKNGVKIITGAAVTEISFGENCLLVKYDLKGKQGEVEADNVLMSVGRRPVLPEGLAETGVEIGRRGIVVDDNMQTSVPGIYAIGDVNARCMLAHAASFQGTRALNHILGKTDHINFDIIPGAVFTTPELSMVGLTEAECEAQGIEVTCKKSMFRGNGKALAMNEAEGIVKLIVRNDNRTIAGCHICGPHAADLIQEIVVAMNAGITVDALKDFIHGHPTLGEAVASAIHQF